MIAAAEHPPVPCAVSAKCRERVARKACSQTNVLPCIYRAAIHYHVTYTGMVARARCESGLDPTPPYTSPPNRGLFQFNYPGTWGTTPYRGRSVLSAKWSSLAAAWMIRAGRSGEWACPL